MVEQWPIVQAYAFEGTGGGGGGFFTLAHAVVDVSPLLHRACQRLDMVELQYILTAQRARFEAQWAEVSGAVAAFLQRTSGLAGEVAGVGACASGADGTSLAFASALHSVVQRSIEANGRHGGHLASSEKDSRGNSAFAKVRVADSISERPHKIRPF